MRLPRWSSLFLLAALCSAGGLTGCQYDPHPVDGALRCSNSGSCPEGYDCQMNRCWSKLGGSSLPTALVDRYVGDWALSTTSAVVTTCDNDFNETTLLSPDPNDPSVMYITRGIADVSDLETSWLCDLSLRLDSGGAHLYEPNPVCGDDAGEPVFTWTATRFDIVTSNGVTATHSATYTRKDEYLDGSIVNCNQTVTATMTKQ